MVVEYRVKTQTVSYFHAEHSKRIQSPGVQKLPSKLEFRGLHIPICLLHQYELYFADLCAVRNIKYLSVICHPGMREIGAGCYMSPCQQLLGRIIRRCFRSHWRSFIYTQLKLEVLDPLRPTLFA
jgi:hypothetical protein